MFFKANCSPPTQFQQAAAAVRKMGKLARGLDGARVLLQEPLPPADTSCELGRPRGTACTQVARSSSAVLFTGGHSKQDQVLLVKIAEHTDFCLYRRPYLIGFPVLQQNPNTVPTSTRGWSRRTPVCVHRAVSECMRVDVAGPGEGDMLV